MRKELSILNTTYQVQEPSDEHLTDKIHIDTNLIPDYVADRLAAATLDMVKRIKKMPGGQELLNRKTAERKAALAAKKRGGGVS